MSRWRTKSESRSKRRERAARARRLRRFAGRRVVLEQLESRWLLNADWQNPFNALDVDDDRAVAPIDVLLIFNELNALPGSGITGADRKLPEITSGTSPPPYLDVNGDGFVSPLDALLIINVLNEDRLPPALTLGLLNDSAPEGTNDDLLTFDPRLQGKATDGAGIRRITARVDGGEPIPLTFDREGQFTFDPGLARDGTADGLHVISVVATDGRGLASAPHLFSFTLDTVAPELQFDLDPAFDSAVVGDRLTNLAAVTFQGQSEPNAIVSIATLGGERCIRGVGAAWVRRGGGAEEVPWGRRGIRYDSHAAR